MAQISGTSGIDWSGVSLAQVNFETDIVLFANRVNQILTEVENGQFSVVSGSQTLLVVDLFSGGRLSIGGSNLLTFSPVINSFNFSNTATGEVVKFTGRIDEIGNTDVLTSATIDPVGSTGVTETINGKITIPLTFPESGSYSGTLSSLVAKIDATTVTLSGNFSLTGDNVDASLTGTVTGISVVSGTNTIQVTGLSLSLDVIEAALGSPELDTVGDILSFLGDYLPGNDVITYTNNSAVGITLDGGAGNDTITLNGTNSDTLIGGAGDDKLNGGAGDDTLNGGDGNDVVLIAAGAHHGAGEVIDGGIGNNVIRFTSTVAGSLVLAAGVTNIAEVEASDAAGGNGGTAALNIDASALASGLTLTGNAGANSLTGTAQADTLNGLGGNDTLIGGDGNDTLNGGVGKDSQQGGAGDDLVLLGSTAEFAAGEVIDGGVGADTLRYTGAAAATLTLTAGVTNVEVVELLAATGPGTAAININAAAVTSNGMTLSGNNGTNILSGTNQADTLIGNGGADNMMGGGGDDLFLLGATTEFAGGERLTGGDGFDTLRYTGNAPATLTLTALVTTIEQVQISDAAGDASGTAAININAAAVANGLVITGNAGNNALTGTAQADTITGGGGADNLNALNGDDLLQLGSTDFAAGEVIDGGEGTDTLRLTGAGQTLDLTAIPDTDVLNIEIIDLAGGGNTLNLTSADVLGINAGQTLRVDGNAADSVFTGDAWTEGGIQTIGGNDYTTYTNGGATLLVDTDVLFNGIELASLDGTDGFKLNGAAALDQLGESTSGAGDVNGDGFDDLIIGAWGAASNGGFVGASYVVFGKASGFEANFELSALDGTNGFKLSGGAAGDRSGISVRSAGDVNGDGFGDVIVGAYRADPNGITDSGASYVVFGKDGVFPASVNLSALTGTDGFRLSGVSNADVSGVSVSGAGDVNGDGFADIIIGAYGADPHGAYSGASYVIFGKADGFNANLNLSALNGSNGFKLSGEAFPDASGISVSGAGDVNGDGFDDIIIGAYRAIEGGNGDAGATYVVFGKSSGFSANIDLSSLTGSDGFKLSGPAQGDRSGRDVSSAGDVNGDGFDDVIIATHRANLYGSPGNTYVVFGKASGFAADTNLSSLDGNSGFTLTGAAAGDFSGRSVGGAGDVNGDGYADLIVGSRFADPNGATSGESYVIFGRSDAFPATIDLSALSTADGLRLRGEAAGDYSGASVSAAGDVNGDGFGDLLVGAYLADPNGTSSGASYVVFGYDARHEVDLLGDDQSNSLTGTGADEILIGGLGNDTLDGAGGTDVLKGGAGNDNLVFDGADRLVDGGSGVDTLQFVSTDQLLDLTAIANNKYTGIEVIDLTGTGDNSLTLETLDLLALSDTTNTLRVDGNAGDAVISQGQGWVAGGQVDVGGTLYQSYADGAATLLLQLSIVGDSLIS